MTTADYDYLIIGGGMVADTASRGIRELDGDGTIGILGREDTPPVTRPALSKKLWTDPEFGLEKAWLGTTADTGAVLHTGTTVVSVDTDARTVTAEDGATYGYGSLLLATGGTPRIVGTTHSDRVIPFRSITDYRRLRELAGSGASAVVVGGSYIGTEIAAALVQNDTETTLVFSEEVLGGSVFPTDLARHFESMFRDAGVRLHRRAHATDTEPRHDEVITRLDDGDELVSSVVVLGLGVDPAVGYLEGTAVETGDGVVVDEHLRTSVDGVWAAGDIAEYPDAILGRRRVEHVDNANEMGNAVGRAMAGADEPYTHTPYYYSAVFGTRYEAVGTLDSSLTTVEDWAEPNEKGVVYYVDGGKVAGVLLWNVEGARDAARAVIRDTTDVSPEALKGAIPIG